MENRLYDTEYRFMEIIWEHAPVRSGELVKLSKEALGWKKSTTYTMIKRLSEKGYIINEDAVVSVLVQKEECQQAESKEVIEKNFSGSLPVFPETASPDIHSDKRSVPDSSEHRYHHLWETGRSHSAWCFC